MSKRVDKDLKMGKKTIVSVITSVYNCEDYVEEMLDSVINQTMQDWEMILIDDASTDNTWDKIQKYDDKRIIKIKNSQNQGLTVNLNKALLMCKGKYIIRIDGDDISDLNRFSTQVEFMETHPAIVLSGGFLQTFGDSNVIYKVFLDEEKLRINLLFNTVIFHPTFIIKRDCLVKHKLFYNEYLKYAQDYNLVYELSKVGKLANIPDILTKYRVHNKQVSNEKKFEQKRYADYTRKQILKDLGIFLSDEEFSCWTEFCVMNCQKIGSEKKQKLLEIKQKIIDYNVLQKIYPHELLEKVLNERMDEYFSICESKDKELADKYYELFQLMNQWIKRKQQGKELTTYFKNEKIYKIAVYGMGEVGERLIEELEGTEIKVVYGIDRRASNIYSDIKVFSMSEKIEKVDMIVVTAIAYYEEIKACLKEKVDCPIVSFKEILYKMQ